MSRYIDADALKKRVSELIVPDWTRTLIRSWLDSEPTVDAVPVVRCSECKHRDYCDIYAHVKDADFFCKAGWMDLFRGERKDGERRTDETEGS